MKRDLLIDTGPLVLRVYAYVAYRMGDGPDAEDVTSETFARALRYRESFDGSGKDVLPWLLGIARRCMAAHFAEQVDTVADVPDIPAAGKLDDDIALRLDVRRLVAGLDERDRDLIGLRYGADLTAAQIGELLGMRVNAVEVALHRLLRRLRVQIEGEVEPQAGPPLAPLAAPDT